MTMDDAIRRKLHRSFEELLDAEQADALMDHVAPDGDRPASSAELARLRQEMDQGFADSRERFAGIDRRFDALFAHIDHRFEVQEHRHRADLHELVGTRLTTHTRTLAVATVGAITANSALVVAAAQLG